MCRPWPTFVVCPLITRQGKKSAVRTSSTTFSSNSPSSPPPTTPRPASPSCCRACWNSPTPPTRWPPSPATRPHQLALCVDEARAAPTSAPNWMPSSPAHTASTRRAPLHPRPRRGERPWLPSETFRVLKEKEIRPAKRRRVPHRPPLTSPPGTRWKPTAPSARWTWREDSRPARFPVACRPGRGRFREQAPARSGARADRLRRGERLA